MKRKHNEGCRFFDSDCGLVALILVIFLWVLSQLQFHVGEKRLIESEKKMISQNKIDIFQNQILTNMARAIENHKKYDMHYGRVDDGRSD